MLLFMCWLFVIIMPLGLTLGHFFGPAIAVPSLILVLLPSVLQRLMDGQMEYDFFGICSSPVACIYFMQEDGKFYIDYEAIGSDQLQYIDKIRQYAAEQGCRVVDTTHGNTPIDFSEPAQAPVLSLRVDTDIDSIANVGARLMQTIFQNTDTIPYEIVP